MTALVFGFSLMVVGMALWAGGPLFFIGIPLFSGGAGTYASLPGLTPDPSDSPIRHESRADLPGSQRDDSPGP